MAASMTSISSVLKRFYLGPIQKQLNNETIVLNTFEKKKVSWAGKSVTIPLHVSRNQGVGFSSTGALPTAGEQGWGELFVTSASIFGRFQISNEALEALESGDSTSFTNFTEGVMMPLKDDVRNKVNQVAVSGGTCVGYLPQSNSASAGADDWMFDGDFSKITALIAENAGPIAVQPYRMDTYAAVGAPINCSAANATTGEITLDAALTTPANTVCALVVTTAGLSNAEESVGIYGNLSLPTHFTFDRTTATGEPILQSNFITTVADGGGAPPAAARTAIDPEEHFQAVMDTVYLAAEEEPDCILMSPLQRSRYAATVSGTVRSDLAGRGGAGKADAAYSGFYFNGLELKVSRHVANGHIIFLKSSTFKYLEKQPFKFEDRDGAIVSRVPNTDSVNGYSKWRYQIVCDRPNANCIVLGLAL